MQYLLTEDEYDALVNDKDARSLEWMRSAQSLLSMLSVAKNYPCTHHSYCNGCELEKSDICLRSRSYGK